MMRLKGGGEWWDCKNCELPCRASDGWWCDNCRVSLSDLDKWYLIGFLGLIEKPNPNGMVGITESGAAFAMGRQDRIGRE